MALVRRADRSLPGGGFATVTDVSLLGVRYGVLGKTLSSSPVPFRPRFYSEGQLLVNSGTVHPHNRVDSPVSPPHLLRAGESHTKWVPRPCVISVTLNRYQGTRCYGTAVSYLSEVGPQISKCTLSSAVCNWVLVWMRTKVSHCVNYWSPQV